MQEMQWETLEARHYKHKLVLLYKMINNITPSYLSDLVTSSVGSSATYSLHNSNSIRNVNARTDLFTLHNTRI